LFLGWFFWVPPGSRHCGGDGQALDADVDDVDVDGGVGDILGPIS